MFPPNYLISWKSKKHDMVSLCYDEVEYLAMCMATEEIIWINGILKSLWVPFFSPYFLYCAITLQLSTLLVTLFFMKEPNMWSLIAIR